MRRHDRGSATVELVVATPLLGLLLMLVVQYALWAHASHVVRAAANSGLQTVRVHGGDAETGRLQTTAMLDELGSGLIDEQSVVVTRTATTATVTVRGRVTSVFPGIEPAVTATVTAPVERTAG